MDDGDEMDLQKEEHSLFCKFLPIDQRDQLAEKLEGADERITLSKKEIDLYQCTDNDGKMKVKIQRQYNSQWFTSEGYSSKMW